jgi:hypothetical protein
VGEEISEEDGDDGIYVGVGGNFCGRFVVDEPDVSGEGDDGAENNQIEQREPGFAGNICGMEIVEFAERGGGDEEEKSSGQHLRGGADDFGCGQRKFSEKRGGDGPSDGGDD